MVNQISDIRLKVKDECARLGNVPEWFFEAHLCEVERRFLELLAENIQADREVVALGVWLHDLQRIRGIQGGHEEAGAVEAEKVMQEFGLDEDLIERVKRIILTHSCKNRQPDTLEGKILATADAMSHYFNDFYLRIACLGQRDADGFKEWVLEKLDRDFNQKIFFESAKQKIQARHDLFKQVFSMD